MDESKTENYRECEIETRVSAVGDFYMGTFRILVLPGTAEVIRLCPGKHPNSVDAHAESARRARRIVDIVKGGNSELGAARQLNALRSSGN